jgi:molybdopterin-guanine dinucleotide biosynthesis protein A
MSHDFAVVILASGEGRRIAGNKPLQMLAGEPFFNINSAKDLSRAKRLL